MGTIEHVWVPLKKNVREERERVGPAIAAALANLFADYPATTEGEAKARFTAIQQANNLILGDAESCAVMGGVPPDVVRAVFALIYK